MGVSSSGILPQLYNLVDKQISDYLKRIPGVGAVQIYGGLERQINVELDKAKLQGHNLSVDRIARRLREENITLPAGNLKPDTWTIPCGFPVNFPLRKRSRILLLPPTARGQSFKDVAKVEDSFKEETMIVRANGDRDDADGPEALRGQYRGGGQENPGEDSGFVRQAPADIKFSVLLDSSEHILQSINDLSQTIYWAGCLWSWWSFCSCAS